jgi:hypothetical protein
MTQPSGTVTVAESGTPALSFGQRVVGMLFSPRATFESVAAHPKFLDVMVLTIGVSLLAWVLFLWSQTGSQAFIDQMVAQAERNAAASGGNAAQASQQVANMFPLIRWFTVIAVPVIGPIFIFLIAGLLYGLFAALLGGGASYKQVVAIVVHAGVISTLGQLVVMGLNYARATMTSATSLAVFAPMLEESSFLYKLLSVIDLVWILYLVVLAMGLAVLYRRKTATIAMSFLSLYVVIAVIIAFFKRGA